MIIEIVLILVALTALYFGASFTVRGSASMAVRLGITPLVIGLTIVAFGTSAPELVVSIKATLSNAGNIVMGNVIGSNIFNICAILGLTAIISPLNISRQIIKIDMPILLIATVLVCVFWYLGDFSLWQGILLFSGIVSYTAFCLYTSKKDKSTTQPGEIKLSKNIYIDIAFIVLGLSLLVVGSNVLVDNSIIIARALGWSDAVIGITIVAIGTSVPEMATSVVAALQKRADIAIGNAIGSNIFNLFSVLGVSSIIAPLSTTEIKPMDMCVFVGSTFLLLLFLYTRYKLSRIEGWILLIIYISYTTILVLNA